MDKFTKCLLTEWRRLGLPFENETFIIAVSGGADSCALWLAVDDLVKRGKLKNRFIAAHFNHNLRERDADEDMRFVQNLAETLGFEFVGKTAAEFIQKNNLEQNARLARYRFLEETAENLKAKWVLTAHTVNDQAETFLQNLIRGSGIEGLGAMPEIRKLNEKRNDEIALVRPLLNWARRRDTENFCRRRKIEFRRDAMNEDLAFNRVRIRKILLPLLEDFNPQIVGKLAQTAKLLREEYEEKSNHENRRMFQTDGEKNELKLNDIKDIFPSMRRRILREWLRENTGDTRRLTQKHIEAIENLAFSRKSGKEIELPGDFKITKSGGKLRVSGFKSQISDLKPET